MSFKTNSIIIMGIETYFNKNVVFNPNYKLRSDENNIIITNNDSAIANSLDLSNNNDFTTGFSWPIHPFIAIMINYFDGKSQNISAESLCHFRIGKALDGCSPCYAQCACNHQSFRRNRAHGINRFLYNNGVDFIGQFMFGISVGLIQ